MVRGNFATKMQSAENQRNNFELIFEGWSHSELGSESAGGKIIDKANTRILK